MQKNSKRNAKELIEIKIYDRIKKEKEIVGG